LISDNLFQKIQGEIHANHHRTIRELHHIIPEVSKTTIHEAVTEKLGYRKLCARWVPKMLTDNHNTKQMGSALKFHKCYAQEGDEFLDSIVTGDETCFFHHYAENLMMIMRW
jgi:histone-lysine N-methyltransferase SETMAR